MARLSVVIPCKNEEKRIGLLLSDLRNQTGILPPPKIYIADAGSTDGTREKIDQFKEFLDIQIISGGIPSVGRNKGASESKEPYVIFIDADMKLPQRDTLEKSLAALEAGAHLVTLDVRCPENKKADFLYRINNQLQRISRFHQPFSTGMFMAWNREAFHRLGGFNEEIHFGEDYHLSKKVDRQKFKVVPGEIWSPDRRFKITGTMVLLKMMVSAFIQRNNPDKLKGDKGYWDHLE